MEVLEAPLYLSLRITMFMTPKKRRLLSLTAWNEGEKGQPELSDFLTTRSCPVTSDVCFPRCLAISSSEVSIGREVSLDQDRITTRSLASRHQRTCISDLKPSPCRTSPTHPSFSNLRHARPVHPQATRLHARQAAPLSFRALSRSCGDGPRSCSDLQVAQ